MNAPRMTSKALDVLTRAIEDGDYSEGWMIETTNHPYRLEGTEGLTIIADGKGDFEAEVFFGHTPRRRAISPGGTSGRHKSGRKSEMTEDIEVPE